jgi:nitrogen fixation protein FixH
MSHAATAPDPSRGRWIPWVFVGGMLVVVAVNATLIWFALTTFTGLTVGHSYDRGRTYNAVIAEAARQEALGWAARVSLEGATLAVAVTDRDGLPVAGRIAGVLLRPLEGTELPLDLAATAPGRFAARVEGLRPGQWEARLTLTGPGQAALDIRQRVIAR